MLSCDWTVVMQIKEWQLEAAVYTAMHVLVVVFECFVAFWLLNTTDVITENTL